MAFSYRDLFCGGKTFCCCLPVRMGVIIMSVLGILFGGVLSIVLWFVASNWHLANGEKAGFVIAGLVETLLLAASVLGLVGAIVRKQTFIQAYAYFTYVHFLLNLAMAGYVLSVVTHFSTNAISAACKSNDSAHEQCTGLLKTIQAVFFVVAALVLLIELYGALVVTRYMNQIKNEKRSARASRLDNEEAFRLVPKGKARYSALPNDHDRGFQSPSLYPVDPIDPRYAAASEFDPYEEAAAPSHSPGPSYAYDAPPAPPIAVGYGGGTWTHAEISEEEKARMKRQDAEMGMSESTPTVDDEEMERRRQEIKSPNGPPLITKLREMEDLPRYTLSDPPRLG